jgi:large subunit ribosomal protein L9
MKVVLLKDVAKTGRKGDVVEVSNGYGVNHLIPKGLAAIATKDAINKAKLADKQKKEIKKEAGGFIDQLAERVDGKKFQISVKASKGGRLYGSLDAKEVSKGLEKQWKVDEGQVSLMVGLAQPIRDTGKYPLEVEISSEDHKRKVDIVLAIVLE